VEVLPLTTADAADIASWRYPDRYATYDVDGAPTSDRGFWAVRHGDELVGYCCFGEEARVPGAVEETGVIDVGYGMRPELMGRGQGSDFIGAILTFAAERFAPLRFRLLILDWNARSRAAASSAGFEEGGAIESTEGTFVVMTRSA
jgi:RimJ/RimL family protein N-acetyltransferase